MKKRNKYFLRAKELVRLKIEENKLREAKNNQGYIELEKPIPDGYVAEWKLREDITRRKDAHVYQEALDVCNRKVYSKKKDFKFKDWKTKKWYIRYPEMTPINKETYESLSASAKKMFYEDRSYSRYWRQGFSDVKYKCILTYELVMDIKVSYLTHRREHDSLLYKMHAENKKMQFIVSNGNPYGGNNYNSKFWRKWEFGKQKTIAMKELRKQLNEE